MLIERLLKVALLGSEWILYLLLALSVLSIATMVERWRYFSRFSGDGDELRKKLGKLLDQDDLSGAAKVLDASRTVEARIAREALRWAPSGADAMGDAVDSELSRVKKELERGLNFLGTLGNNAPFVGLLGTVLGVIMAFSALGTTGENNGAMKGVMSAIAESLVATGVGLFVALPAVVAFNVIQKRIGEVETEAQSLTKLISAYLKAGRGSPSSLEGEAASAEEPHQDEAEAKSSSGAIEVAGAA
jgi:biopolymer transport protein ExbB/biopolymer transport protein TolQ